MNLQDVGGILCLDNGLHSTMIINQHLNIMALDLLTVKGGKLNLKKMQMDSRKFKKLITFQASLKILKEKIMT
jgi:hypothetical protein